jgi:hypothetical protein
MLNLIACNLIRIPKRVAAQASNRSDSKKTLARSSTSPKLDLSEESKSSNLQVFSADHQARARCASRSPEICHSVSADRRPSVFLPACHRIS